jgi:hypothetical protein
LLPHPAMNAAEPIMTARFRIRFMVVALCNLPIVETLQSPSELYYGKQTVATRLPAKIIHRTSVKHGAECHCRSLWTASVFERGATLNRPLPRRASQHWEVKALVCGNSRWLRHARPPPHRTLQRPARQQMTVLRQSAVRDRVRRFEPTRSAPRIVREGAMSRTRGSIRQQFRSSFSPEGQLVFIVTGVVSHVNRPLMVNDCCTHQERSASKTSRRG